MSAYEHVCLLKRLRELNLHVHVERHIAKTSLVTVSRQNVVGTYSTLQVSRVLSLNHRYRLHWPKCTSK